MRQQHLLGGGLVQDAEQLRGGGELRVFVGEEREKRLDAQRDVRALVGRVEADPGVDLAGAVGGGVAVHVGERDAGD
jgi:hypothetical protein